MMVSHSFAALLIVVTAASASAQPSGNDNESRTTPSRPAESRAVDHSSSTIATTTKGTGEKSDSGPSRDSVRHSGNQPASSAATAQSGGKRPPP
jgi:hypothetical protein